MSGVVWRAVGCLKETNGGWGLKTHGCKHQEHRSHVTGCHEKHPIQSHFTCLCDVGACIIVHIQHYSQPCAKDHGTPRGTHGTKQWLCDF